MTTETLTTRLGRTLRVDVEPPDGQGRVVYCVRGVGAFTLGPNDDNGGERRAHVHYGRAPAEGRYYGRDDLPDAPTVNRVTLNGAAVFAPDQATDPTPRSSWWLACRRITGPYGATGSAPVATRDRAADIVSALVRHWLARSDHESLWDAHAKFYASGRLIGLQLEAARLREQIEGLQHELRSVLAAADVQVALTIPAPEGTTPCST